jgi:hypothetical protein
MTILLFVVIDAMGKPPSGIMDFHIHWIGEWGECIDVQAIEYQNPVNKTGPSHPFTGEYCLASIPLGNQVNCHTKTVRVMR